MSELTAVVSGSFNHIGLPRIQVAVRELEHAGFRVLAPLIGGVEGAGGDFPLLNTDDRTKSPRELERGFLEAIGGASLHITVNPVNGRIGKSSTAEFAYAAVHGVARCVTTTSQITSRDCPSIWFAEVTSAEEAALNRLSWAALSPMRFCEDRAQLQAMVNRTEPLPDGHPDRSALIGIYNRLLAELPDSPLPGTTQ